MKTRDCWRWGLVALILSGGAFLRLFRLGQQSLWSDELATWLYSSAPSLSAWWILFTQSSEPFPGGYLFGMHLWERVAGESAWALRFPSAVAAVLSLPALFFAAKRICGEREAVLSLALCSFNFNAVWMAQDARPYSLVFLFSCVYAYALSGTEETWFVDRAPRWSDEVLLFLSALGLSQIHYFGVFLVGLGALWLMFRARAARSQLLWRIVSLYAAVGLLFLPWMPRLLEHFAYSRANTNIPLRSFAKMLSNFFEISFFQDDGNLSSLSVFSSYGLRICLLAYFVLGLRPRPPRSYSMLLGWLIVPFLTVWLKSQISQPVYRARYLAICLPAVYMAIASVLVRSLPRRAWLVVAGFTFSLSLLLHLLIDQSYFGTYRKSTLREDFARIEEFIRASPQTALWTCFPRAGYPEYFTRGSEILRQAWQRQDFCDFGVMQSALAERQGVSAIVFFYARKPPEGLAARTVQAGWKSSNVLGSPPEGSIWELHR